MNQKEYAKQWYLKNKNKCSENSKRYYQNHKEKIKNTVNKYRIEHRGIIIEKKKKYYMLNKEKIFLQSKLWRKNNIKKHRSYLTKCNNNLRFFGNREKVLKRDNYMCQYCGTVKKLCVHHIDRNNCNSENPNNNMRNLITLCRSCHQRIHHTKIASYLGFIEYLRSLI